MLFFERLGCSAGAMQCAHAALHEVEGGVELEQQEDAAGVGPAAAEPVSRRRQRAARLWANLLQYALDLGQWRGAYATVLSVPGVEAQSAALRRLVAVRPARYCSPPHWVPFKSKQQGSKRVG